MATPGPTKSPSTLVVRRRRFRRGFLVALVVAGWLIVLAVAAGRRPDQESWVGVPDLSGAAIWVVIAVAFVGLVLLTQLRSSGYAQGRPSGGMGTLLATTVAIMAIILVVMDGDIDLSLGSPPAEEAGEQVPAGLEPGGGLSRLPESTVQTRSWDIGIGLAIVAGAVVLGLVSRRPSPVELERSHQVDDEVDDLLDRGPGDDALRRDLVLAATQSRTMLDSISDPRQAVLAAYSHLDAVVGRHGEGRLRHETASEHVTRILASHAMEPYSLQGLARLYEAARFSTRELVAGDRQTALRLLDEAIQQLTAHQTSSTSGPS